MDINIISSQNIQQESTTPTDIIENYCDQLLHYFENEDNIAKLINNYEESHYN